MPRIDTAAGELFYTIEQGPTDGPTLLLVHGAGGSRLHWPPELRRMAEATVYTLDLPGHGRSEGSGCETIECYAQTVIAFLKAADVGQVTVVGHSMGGAIAQNLALEHLDCISALGLIATGARLRVAPAILENIRDNFDHAVTLITRYAWAPDAQPSLVELGREALEGTGPDVLFGDFLACDRFDVMDRMGEIEVPVLVVNGTADRLTPVKYARFLAEQIRDARLVTVERAGHMVMLERPDEVGEAFQEFVTESH
jgi:pimeloyl-ACP methyl ester carboxylesterase